MKDRVYMAIAFLGFIILCVVFVFNYEGDKLDGLNTYDMGVGYYIPHDMQKNNSGNADELYQQLVGSRKLTCPLTRMAYSSNSTEFTMIYTSTEKSFYGNECYFLNRGEIGLSDLLTRDNLSLLGSISNDSIKFSDLCITSDKCEIVAPFNFKFANNNTDNGNDIVIVNNLGNCRITFTNVTNWYCAGLIGTSMETGSGTEENSNSWEDHDSYHQSIIGSSRNAVVTSGQARQVIGYGNPDTTVCIESKRDDNTWVPITIDMWVQSYK